MDEVKDATGREQGQQIRLDQSAARTTYANFLYVATGTEEIIVTFGVSTGEENTVRVNDKVILSPKNAKRLAIAMSQAIKLYEEKVGVINLGVPAAEGAKK